MGCSHSRDIGARRRAGNITDMDDIVSESTISTCEGGRIGSGYDRGITCVYEYHKGRNIKSSRGSRRRASFSLAPIDEQAIQITSDYQSTKLSRSLTHDVRHSHNRCRIVELRPSGGLSTEPRVLSSVGEQPRFSKRLLVR